MLKKFKNKIILRILRSYKILANTNDKEKSYEILSHLMQFNKFTNKYNFLDQYFFGNLLEESNIIVKQFFFHTFVYENKIFNRFLLYFFYKKGMSFFVLPKFALEILDKKIKINFILSFILFKIYQIIKIFKGIFFFLLVIVKSLSPKKQVLKNGVLFFNAVKKLFPYKNPGFDMISSILRNDNKVDHTFYSDLKSSDLSNSTNYLNLFNLKKLSYLFYFFLHFIILLFFSILGLFTKKWYLPLLFEEALKKKIIDLTDKEFLPNKIYFNQTSFIYRPMWTYNKNRKIFDVAIIMFGLNIYKSDANESFFTLMNWPEYFLWSNNHKNKLSQILNYSFKYTICDYIGFNDTKNSFDKKIEVIIFDDEPFRSWYKTSYIKYDDHWNEEDCLNYLKDLIEVFSKKEIKVGIKLKKFNNTKTTKKYLKFINDNKFNFVIIDSKFSAIEIIKKVKLVVSYPFSTTALIAKKQNIESIYYFPSKLKNKPLVDEDIKILEGKQELLKYLNQIKT